MSVYKMPEFYVCVTETLCKKVLVSAYDEEEAVAKVKNMYDEGEIVLDSMDYVSTEYDCLGDRRELEDYDD